MLPSFTTLDYLRHLRSPHIEYNLGIKSTLKFKELFYIHFIFGTKRFLPDENSLALVFCVGTQEDMGDSCSELQGEKEKDCENVRDL